MVKLKFPTLAMLLLLSCLCVSGDDLKVPSTVASKSVYHRDMIRSLSYSIDSKKSGDKSRRVYANPPSVTYWVTSVISSVTVIADFDSASSSNDKVVVSFDVPVQCGDASHERVCEVHLYYNDNMRIGAIEDSCDFMPGDRISLGFCPNGDLFDIICPVDSNLKSIADWKGRLEQGGSGGTPE